MFSIIYKILACIPKGGVNVISVVKLTSMFTVHGRHVVVTWRPRSRMECLVAGSGHTKSKSPLKKKCMITLCSYVWIYAIIYDSCPIISYLKIQTGNFFSISHVMVDTMEIGASVQFKFLQKSQEVVGETRKTC